MKEGIALINQSKVGQGWAWFNNKLGLTKDNYTCGEFWIDRYKQV